jgi:hypothetical protein
MIETLISWDGNSFAPSYRADFVLGTEPRLPPVAAEMAARTGAPPLLGAVSRDVYRFSLLIVIEDPTGLNYDALRSQLFAWLDPDDETPKRLVAETTDGVEVYVEAVCEELRIYGDPQQLQSFVATLAVHGDTLWRSTSDDVEVWSITASGQTVAVTNLSEAEAYPRLTIEPTGAKTAGNDYNYRRFVPVRWRRANKTSGGPYPVDICNANLDTAALVLAGKMQADGDDLRVFVDGYEVTRWLDGIDTANTKVWVSLEFPYPAASMTTVDAMLAGETVSSLQVNEGITTMPAYGILVVDNEVFTYTGKDNALRTFLGVTRAAKDSTAAGHAAGSTVWLCQNDVWILYGNPTASAPPTPTIMMPAFNMSTSTNTSWDYDEFGADGAERSGAWARYESGGADCYTGNRGASANPWVEIGIRDAVADAFGRWYLYNPCGITDANFQNGERYYAGAAWDARIQSLSFGGGAWITWYNIPAPALATTWEAWSRNQAMLDEYGVALYLAYPGSGAPTNYVEAADVTLALNGSYTPTVLLGDEHANYSLACTIANTTTGEAVTIEFHMSLDESLEVDTSDKTVTYLEDGTRQFQALSLAGSPRRDWLPLQPGVNVLRFDDTGTTAVTVTVEWAERYYS